MSIYLYRIIMLLDVAKCSFIFAFVSTNVCCLKIVCFNLNEEFDLICIRFCTIFEQISYN